MLAKDSTAFMGAVSLLFLHVHTYMRMATSQGLAVNLGDTEECGSPTTK